MLDKLRKALNERRAAWRERKLDDADAARRVADERRDPRLPDAGDSDQNRLGGGIGTSSGGGF